MRPDHLPVRLIFFISIIFSVASAQYSGQINYSTSNLITALGGDGELLWAATGGTLVGMNKSTGEKLRFSKAATGLPFEDVSALCQGSAGPLWIGFNSAPVIARYSQNAFSTAAIGNASSVKCLLRRSNGIPVAATDKWLFQFDGTSWAPTAVRRELSPTETITCMAEDSSGNLWIAVRDTGDYIMHWSDYEGYVVRQSADKQVVFDSSVCPLLATAVYSIAVDNRGLVWFSTYKGSAGSFDGTTWTDHSDRMILIDTVTLHTERPIPVTASPDGEVRFATICDSLAIRMFDGDAWNLVVPADSTMKSDFARCMFTDTHGTTWIASYTRLLSLDASVFAAHRIDDFGGLTPPLCITETGRNGTWIGTQRGILIYYLNSEWTGVDYTNTGLPRGAVKYLFNDSDDTTWAVTDTGIYYSHNLFDWSRLDLGNFNTVGSYSCILKDAAGRLWIGTSIGLIQRFQGTCILAPLPAEEKGITDIRCIFEDSRGNVWVGGILSVSRYDGENWTVYSVNDSTLPRFSSPIGGFAETPDGSILVHEQYDAGMAVCDSAAVSFTPYEAPYLASLENVRVSALFYDHNNLLWCGTDGYGVYRWDGTAVDSLVKSNSALTDNSVHFIMEDRNRMVWIGTDEGIVVYTNASDGVRPAAPVSHNRGGSSLTASFNPASRNVTVSLAPIVSSPSELSIVALDGTLVWTTRITGEQRVCTWPCVSNGGRSVGAGLYIVRYHSSNETRHVPVMVTR